MRRPPPCGAWTGGSYRNCHASTQVAVIGLLADVLHLIGLDKRGAITLKAKLSHDLPANEIGCWPGAVELLHR